MLKKIAQALWGKFESRDELKKFTLLATIFGFIIGSYWAMRPLKDGIFSVIVGINYQPWAKILSLFVIVPLVILYGKLTDKYPRQKVFYALTSLYGFAAIAFMFAFLSPTMGLANTVASPSRLVGWAWYVYVESFGSLIVALFWAFTTDIAKPDEAKRGFPLIALLGQSGNIVGPFVLRASRFGFATSAPIVGIIGLLMFVIGFLMWVFVQVTPKDQLKGYEGETTKKEESHEEPGFLDGLKLLLSHGYLMAITSVIIIYEVIITILDFFFKSTAKAAFPTEVAYSEYLSQYAVYTGIVATTCVFLGINSIQRKMGMTASLLLLPSLVAAAVLTLWFNPVLSFAFWIMVFSKAINYALNQPTLKQLYIPTSKETKYKSQAWIEMFGSRGSKAIGSGVNTLKGTLAGIYGTASGAAIFLMVSSVVSLGFIGVWFLIAMYIARTYNKAIKENKLVC